MQKVAKIKNIPYFFAGSVFSNRFFRILDSGILQKWTWTWFGGVGLSAKQIQPGLSGHVQFHDIYIFIALVFT